MCIFFFFCLESFLAHATLETWTWAPSATWPRPPWQCGKQVSWRPMAIRPQTTSTGPRGHSDSTTQTLWATGSSYPHSQRCVGQMYLRSEHILSSGPKVLQRLPKGHRNCKHLFRGTYGIWWVTILSKPTENHQWNVFPRIREVAKDDLVGLHLRLWWSLWTLCCNMLGSALCLSLRFSTGSSSGFWGSSDLRTWNDICYMSCILVQCVNV